MQPALTSRAAADRVLDAVPPASGAVVMGTGIVSVALSLAGYEAFSRVLAVLDGAFWVALGVLLPARAARDRERFRRDARGPAALTCVAGTAVLGTRVTLFGWSELGDALLVLALLMWLALVPRVLRHWGAPAVGVSFVLTVSTESLALLAVVLGHEQAVSWLLYAALAPFALGLAFYLFVLRGFDFHQLAVGRGDHWVTGGALAISTVVAGRLAHAAGALGVFGEGGLDALREISLGLWAATMAWLPLLLAVEVLRPRLCYDVRRWSTVFPVGMYAACSFVVGEVADAGPLSSFARGWLWVAVAVWALVLAAMARRAVQVVRGSGADASARPTARAR